MQILRQISRHSIPMDILYYVGYIMYISLGDFQKPSTAANSTYIIAFKPQLLGSYALRVTARLLQPLLRQRPRWQSRRDCFVSSRPHLMWTARKYVELAGPHFV